MPDLVPGYGASDARWFSMASLGDQNTFNNGQYHFATTPITVQTDYYAALAERKADSNIISFDHDWILKIVFGDRITNKLDYQPNILLILGSMSTQTSKTGFFHLQTH